MSPNTLLLLFLGLLVGAIADEGLQYQTADPVYVYANKVGPFRNPTETYAFYSLPYCPSESQETPSHDLGELLSGDQKVHTPYDVRYKMKEPYRQLCERKLQPHEVEKFVAAIDEDYFFELNVDGLPIMGFVGEIAEDPLVGRLKTSKRYLFTHFHFHFEYNADRIITANVTLDRDSKLLLPSPATEDMNVRFSYSVSWSPTTVLYADRMEVYAAHHFLPNAYEIHWLSIINSTVLVILLVAFLAVILMRAVHVDFERSGDETESEDIARWKQVHGDVFRAPDKLNWFCALVGAGTQVLVLIFVLLLISLVRLFHPTRRGSVLSASIVIYALTTWVSGFVSARLYKKLKGKSWVWNIMLSAIILPGPLLFLFMFLNTTAILHASTAALDAGTIFIVIALFLFVAFPLTVIGGIVGRNTQEFHPPCHVKQVPREIPPLPWYRRPVAQIAFAGFLPFTAISIELHYVFAAVWGQSVYTLFGILLVAVSLLVLVASFLVVAFTYFQLAAEDHKWWWRSFLSGGSVGFFVLLYSILYFHNHTEMQGFMQTSFYFGYMAYISYTIVLAIGSAGFFSAFLFVNYIYKNGKLD